MKEVTEGSKLATYLLTIPEVGDKVFCTINSHPSGEFEIETIPSLTIVEVNGLPSEEDHSWKALLFGTKLDGGIYTYQVRITLYATEEGDIWLLHPDNNEGNECFN